MTFKTVSITSSSKEQIESAAQLLESYWPGNELKTNGETKTGLQRRIEKLENLAKHKKQGYILLKDVVVIGFFCLQKAKTKLGEFSCAITSVIIDSTLRGKGYGRILMEQAFEIARAESFMYMYLWTSEAIEFYRKCGFFICDKVNLDSPVLNRLTNVGAFLGKLNAQFKETIAKSEEDEKETDTWLKYRLIEYTSSIIFDEQTLKEDVYSVLKSQGIVEEKISFYLNNVGWYRQIGPSCGFQCLRTAKEYFSSEKLDNGDLIKEARKRGLTVDGEIFHIDSLLTIASDMLKMKSRVIHINETSSILTLCKEILKGNLVILPYDKSSQQSKPGKLDGLNAHYTTIVGVCFIDEGYYNTTQVIAESLNLNLVYFVTQHGLSKKILVDKAINFYESNNQLNNRTSRLEAESMKEGIDLKAKCLLLEKEA